MILKNNSINDPQIINKISEASCAGVRVDMIVRGICCIKAGVPGQTENVHIRSIVGRYLEHSRIYCFGEGEDMTHLYRLRRLPDPQHRASCRSRRAGG